MPKAADTHTTPTASPDAELIRLCAEVVAIQDKINALHKVRHTVEDERRTEPVTAALPYFQRAWLLWKARLTDPWAL